MTSHDYPPIDAEIAQTVWPILLEQQKQGAQLTDEQFQQQVASGYGLWDPDLSHGGRIQARESTISSASGNEKIPVLVLSPTDGEGPFPCLYYTANGGKMQHSAKVGLTSTDTAWVAELGIVLVSIAPRVGPEHPHPAQVEDAYAGLQWIVEHADELRIDPAKIIIMGKSGGGGVAATLALYARDHGGPSIANQMLIYPMIDDRTDNPSSHFDVPPWTASNNRVGWKAILGDSAGGGDVSPYAAAARAENLEGLPPTYVEVGSAEVFRDESLDYGARLARAGVPVEVHSWMGGFHAFEIMAPASKVAEACLMVRTNYLQRALFSLSTSTS
jgi:acetyl esterase/lipase